MKVYKWFAGTSGQGLSERARMVMAPAAPKSEGEMAEALDKWLEGLKYLGKHKGYDLPVRLKVTAMKNLMVGRAKDSYEDWVESKIKSESEDEWKDLVNKVQDYATRRRLEAQLAKNKDSMDIGEVDENGYGQWEESWDPWAAQGSNQEQPWDIDALGKGKAMGKGAKGKGKGKGIFSGQCYNCNEWGHSAKFCPKGKGKGKGKDSRQCWQCGEHGHLGRDCPTNPYKGKGKGDKGNGKGKGIWAVEGSWDPWAVNPSAAQGSWPPPPVAAPAQGSQGMNLGGSIDQSCGSVERDGEWQVSVNRSRSKWDMRKAKRVGFCKIGCDCRDVNSLERDSRQDAINAVDQFRGDWEKVSVTVDSGAIDSVIPTSVAQGVPTKATTASQQGLKYRAANGTPIVNEGEKTLKGYTNEGSPVGMTMQVAKVTKPLGSVRAMVEANNRVVFDKGGSYILDKATWAKTKIDERNGAFVVDMWIPKGRQGETQVNTGRYQALMEEEDREDSRGMGFVGLDDLF